MIKNPRWFHAKHILFDIIVAWWAEFMTKNRYSIWRKTFQAQSHEFHAQTSTNLLCSGSVIVFIPVVLLSLSTRHAFFFLKKLRAKPMRIHFPPECRRSMCALRINNWNIESKILKWYKSRTHHVISSH